MIMRNKGNDDWVPPPGSILLTQREEHEWTFEYPRLSADAHDRLDHAIDAMGGGNVVSAESDLRQLLAQFPEFIDAGHHLAMLLLETGRNTEAFTAWQRAVDIAVGCFPRTFAAGRDALPWYDIDNRPFLRAYHGYGLQLRQQGFMGLALKVFGEILALNPNDNQGVRALVIDGCFHLGRPEDVLDVCKEFDGDSMAETIYGKVLALLQLKSAEEATSALREAIGALPLVAKELTKQRHRRPKSEWPGCVSHEGPDQAYEYWKAQGEHWANTPDAIAFVAQHLSSSA